MTQDVIPCDQPRTLDIRARGGKKLERVPEWIMDDVLSRMRALFDDDGLDEA
jgi:mRNA interferase ChpB